MHNIPYNKPFISGNELQYIGDAVGTGKISGDGKYTKLCQQFLEKRYGFSKALLTTSCTDALEMCALLCDIMPGDEVIAPSYTFVSSVNPFVLRGAVIRFADSRTDHPGIDEQAIEALINNKTKAIVVTHYAGISCDMDVIMALSAKYKLWVIEDAAHAIDSYFGERPLGSIGHMAAFSFHETKNIIAGEGGMVVLNDISLIERAEILREKGTNRSKFFRGEIDKYSWVDVGSSFLPSDITAAFLFAQLENIEVIQAQRKRLWVKYYDGLSALEVNGFVKLPSFPAYACNNAHIFYLLTHSTAERTALIAYLKEQGILSIFHYIPLHSSEYYFNKHDGRDLPMTDYYADHLLRLPLFFTLTNSELEFIISKVHAFYASH